MSDQAAPPVPPAHEPPPERPGQGSDTDSLHKHALAAEKALELLATDLAHAGVDKSVTGAVSKMADSMRKIVQAMGKTQPPPDEAPAEPAPAQPPHTMHSATDALVNDVRAARGH